MSEFGIKIKNIEASTLYEYNNGVRDHYEYKDVMFTNSLFGNQINKLLWYRQGKSISDGYLVIRITGLLYYAPSSTVITSI